MGRTMEEMADEGVDHAWRCANNDCDHVEEADHGPGMKAHAPRCPECHWPMDSVFPNVAVR